MTDRKKVLEYFVAPKPVKPTLRNNKRLQLGALLFFLCAATFGVGAYYVQPLWFILSVLLFIGGGVAIHKPRSEYRDAVERYAARPSEQEMDEWLMDDFQSLVRKNAVAHLDIPEEKVEKYLIVPGPVYTPTGGISQNAILRINGKDGKTRYSIWNLVVIVLTKNHVSTYKCLYDWVKNIIAQEQTNEFTYDKIVAVRTESNPQPRPLVRNEGTIDYVETFKIIVNHDEPEKVETNYAQFNPPTVVVSESDKTIKALRSILRQKQTPNDGEQQSVAPAPKEEVEKPATFDNADENYHKRH